MIKPRLAVHDRSSISHRAAYACFQCNAEETEKKIRYFTGLSREAATFRWTVEAGGRGRGAHRRQSFFSGVLRSGYRELVRTKW